MWISLVLTCYLTVGIHFMIKELSRWMYLQKDEKQLFTVLIGSLCSGKIIPPQFVFSGGSPQSLPKATAPGMQDAEAQGFHFAFAQSEKSGSHFSTFKTMCKWCNKIILIPYINEVIRVDGLSPTQKAIVFLDIYALHRGAQCRDWVYNRDPQIIILI
jgi:hypothetical protein